MNFDMLLEEANAEGLTVKERPFSTYDGRIKGKNIYLRNDMTSTEKACVLAEELGHYYTTAGNILDQSDAGNRKQEFRARLHGYNRMVGLMGIIKAYEHGCRNLYEMAEHLEVTEQFLQEALLTYRSKYGIYKELDNYIIFFEPQLAVLKKFED